MSSSGTLAKGEYTKEAINMARKRRDFVIGFIAMNGIEKDAAAVDNEDFLILTPGVGLDEKGDALGQQYRTPREVISAGADVIIVGRGIYGEGDGLPTEEIVKQAERYRTEGWLVYQQHLESNV